MVLRRPLIIILIAILLPVTAFATNKYIVKKGDNLYDLSKKFGVSVEDLKSTNSLKGNRLDIGDELIIPDPNNTNNKVDSNTNTSNNNAYIVTKGDTLSEIAGKHGVSTRDLTDANKLKNTQLQIGQKLLIPAQNKLAPAIPETGAIIEAASQAASENLKPTDPEVKPSLHTGEYTVQKGDTLGHIAIKLNVTSREIRTANGLKNDRLQIGQILKIPSSSPNIATAQASNDTPHATINSDTGIYIVEKGDTPGGIAEKLGVRTNDLIKLNNLDSRHLRIGQKLSIPGAKSPDGTSGNLQAKAESSGAVNTDTEAPRALPDEYTVQKGDNLYDISTKFGTTVDYIKKKNNLRSNNLSIGQKLVLTTRDTTEPAPAQAEKSGAAVSPSKYTERYTVRKGDTIGHLAIRFGVPQSELKRVNGLNSNALKIGQVLTVPGAEKKEMAVVRETAPQTTNEIYIKKRYTVRAGDTLSGIANSFGVTVGEVKKASALKNDTINTGDILLIPIPQEKVTTSQHTAYKVAAGDTLGTIGRRFGVSVKELKNANGMTSDRIRVGMKLNIPGVHSTESTVPVKSKVVATPSPRGKYVVKRGDTLGQIAKRHGVSVTELKRENNIRGNIIRVGQVLTFPGSTKQETAYIAVNDNSIANSNGHNKHTGTGIKNGRFSKESIIQVAKQYLGAPYKFGGYDFTTGIDCSGYVKKIFSRFNVQLPRTARDIYYRAGNKVDKSQLDSGDLVFFQTYAKYPSHVGIYIGNDEFIHASSASKMVTINSINKRYYRKRYIGAKRVQLSGLFYDEYSKDYRGFDN